MARCHDVCGHVVVPSFALDGPTRCSGLEVVRYSPDTMHAEFRTGFSRNDPVTLRRAVGMRLGRYHAYTQI